VLSLTHRTGPFRHDPLNWHLLPDGGTRGAERSLLSPGTLVKIQVRASGAFPEPI
jgi:hypothetical protein